jgi:hypothetical protein
VESRPGSPPPTLLPSLAPSADPPDLLLGPRPRRFKKSGEGERRADQCLQEVQPLGPPRLVPCAPAGDLGPLLAVGGENREALWGLPVLYIEERLAVEGPEGEWSGAAPVAWKYRHKFMSLTQTFHGVILHLPN